jgi:hypothetical protein
MSALPKVLLGLILAAALCATLVWLAPAEWRTALRSALPALQGKVIESEPAEPMAVADEDDDGDSVAHRIQKVNGAPAVRLTAEEQRYSGIRTEPLERITYWAEEQVYGEVVDIQPLLRLRGQYAEAQAQRQMAQARLQVSAQEYERLRGLNAQGNVISTSRMREAQSRWRINQAQLAAAETRARNIRAQAVQAWGTELVAQALGDNSELMERLVSRETVLLRITLAPDESLPQATRFAFVERNGERRRAREARLISPAPRTDLVSQGETYFYQTAADGLRTGMRVAAWIPENKAPSMGVLVPAIAAVWYGGQPWVYVQVGDELFARRALRDDNEIAGGWLARDGFSAGEPVVVAGGQMLLSEEFRWQIPEEDND